MIQGDEQQQRAAHNGKARQPAGHARAMQPLDDAEQQQGQRHDGQFEDQQISPRSRRMVSRKMRARQWCSAGAALAVGAENRRKFVGKGA